MFPNRLRRTRSVTASGNQDQVRGTPQGVRGVRANSGTVARRGEPRPPSQRTLLSEAVMRSLAARRYGDALGHILNLIALEPDEPRWHQKYGEVLRTLGRNREAAAAYRRAARRYEALALPARASAVLRVADALDGAASSEPMAQRSSDRVLARVALRPDERPTSRPPQA